MNANEFADELEKAPTLWFKDDIAGKWIIEKLRQQQEQIDKLTAIVALRELKIERMVEKQSHYEAMAHAGGVEVGKELKILTDEEIQELAFEYLEKTDKGIVGIYDFVRAIIQKINNG